MYGLKIVNIEIIFALLAAACSKTPREVTRYSIEQLSENIAISGGVFSEGESKLLISNNETGIFNIYEINIEDGSSVDMTPGEQ